MYNEVIWLDNVQCQHTHLMHLYIAVVMTDITQNITPSHQCNKSKQDEPTDKDVASGRFYRTCSAGFIEMPGIVHVVVTSLSFKLCPVPRALQACCRY